MNKTKIAATITLVAMVTNFSGSTTSVSAHQTKLFNHINHLAQMEMTLPKNQKTTQTV